MGAPWLPSERLYDPNGQAVDTPGSLLCHTGQSCSLEHSKLKPPSPLRRRRSRETRTATPSGLPSFPFAPVAGIQQTAVARAVSGLPCDVQDPAHVASQDSPTGNRADERCHPAWLCTDTRFGKVSLKIFDRIF
jgi:hypothetical protein